MNSDKGGLWREVIEFKYGGWRGLKELQNDNNKVSLWWRDLMKVWSSEEWGRKFEDRINWEIRNGKDVLFW